MGIAVDMAQVDAYVKEMDTDGSGELEFNEVLHQLAAFFTVHLLDI